MSTGLNCLFREHAPSKWYYIIEDWNAPKMAWDWRAFATAYGPFKTREAADDHLDRNHANPGGSNTSRFADTPTDPVLDTLLASAIPPQTP